MGWWRIIALLLFYLELMLFLEKWIHDRNSVDGSEMLQTLSQKDLAPTLFGEADHKGIPEGDIVQPIKVDGGPGYLRPKAQRAWCQKHSMWSQAFIRGT